MTVFKGFLTITKRNLGYVFMYIIIFLTITFRGLVLVYNWG